MKRFKNILCVVTPSDGAMPTLERAISLAENNQAALRVLEVIPAGAATSAGPDGDGAWQAALLAEHREALARFIATHRRRGEIQQEVRMGTGFIEIIRALLRNGHDLVIKPAEDPGFLPRLFGCDDMQLLRKCPCPVWLTKPGEKANYGRILAALDIEGEMPDVEVQALNRRILELAASLALSDFAELHLVHAWDAPGELAVRMWSDDPAASGPAYVAAAESHHRLGLDRLREQLREQIGADAFDYLAPHCHLHRGPASLVIPDAARRLAADLVVMGTVSRTGIAGLFIGNTAEAILEQLNCSVLAIKPPGFVSPVDLAD